MGMKKSQNGKARRGNRRGRGTTGVQPPHQQPVLPGSSSRLLLTRLLKDGELWEVFVASTPTDRAASEVRLEFERKVPDGDPIRHSRPLAGALLEALHSGAPLSRRALEGELEKAIRNAPPGTPPPEGE